MSENKYTILEFIKYILSFFLHRREKAEVDRNKKLNKTVDELDGEFKKIDDKKEDKKQEDIEKRLNNMF